MSEQANQFLQQATQALNDGQYMQALELADQAIAASPTFADAHVLKGIALAQTGQPDAATASFRQAISLDPANAKAYYNLATHQYQMGQKQEALAMAREALRIDQSHVAARDLVARIEQETAAPAWAPAPPSAPPTGAPGPAPQPMTYRPGYESRQTGTIAFVENMGSTWTAIGWILAAITILMTFYSIYIVWDMFSVVFANPQADPNKAMESWQAKQGAMFMVMQIVSTLSWLAIIVWGVLDIANRRGNWLWLIAFICCQTIGLPVYLVAGRKT